MKFTYPAVFHRNEEGRFEGYFPDLEGIYVTGNDLDDAIRNAILEEGDWIRTELLEDDPQLPPVSEPEEIRRGEGDIVRNIAVIVRFYEGWDE